MLPSAGRLFTDVVCTIAQVAGAVDRVAVRCRTDIHPVGRGIRVHAPRERRPGSRSASIDGVGDCIAANPLRRIHRRVVVGIARPHSCRSSSTASRRPCCHRSAIRSPSASAHCPGCPTNRCRAPPVVEPTSIQYADDPDPAVQSNVTVLPVNVDPGMGVVITPAAADRLYAV